MSSNRDGSWTDEAGGVHPLLMWNVRESGNGISTEVVAHSIQFAGDWALFYTDGLITDSFYKPDRITPDRNTRMGCA